MSNEPSLEMMVAEAIIENLTDDELRDTIGLTTNRVQVTVTVHDAAHRAEKYMMPEKFDELHTQILKALETLNDMLVIMEKEWNRRGLG